MKRIVTQLKACYRLKGSRDSIDTLVVNLSPTGVCFEAADSASYSPQEPLELTVALDDGQSIHMTGVVVWAHNGHPLPERCVGLKIIDMSPEDELRLMKFYQYKLSRSGRERDITPRQHPHR